ncbi:VapC toxin family PIN domain ribonuclease [Salmonella enterica subsp. enterica serovar Java]|nr:VapC toxin family PIN domain ribonuclease [Salmonella enterica]EBX2066774.1 VapC toxin family PIN domain ribonuclease [Salmonella enterica subsp. enterica serovar Java]EEL9261366.1 VapC toxin family PIN domain ribonuclease [Salmonella enterica subsp. enterica serovar Enteritidis]EHE8613107.1 VapC toxin family PIN domain ribonuclease [Salmonella enterica subsp. enterica serovar 4,[5],12:b:-]ECB7403822.1 VapC toxin family PIN domain ribonuclease [Salmonella enterica subsp. enterica serovar Jav
MAILVDTSVWVAHFKSSNDGLIQLLNRDLVLIHPMILAEIACGTPPAPRRRTLGDLGLLPQSHQASIAEVMAFIENNKLYGLGCGLVDLTLLASTLITPGARLWTLDKRLAKLAKHLNVDYQSVH